MRTLLALLLLVLAIPAFAKDSPDLVLRGALSGKDIHTYRNVTFDVPKGVTRITIDFEATGKEEHTTIDLGLLGPEGFRGQNGFRGWSGGSKRSFTVSATDATPAFLPGPIEPGRWTLLLGIPNIRPAAHATYTARVWFTRDAATSWGPDIINPPLRKEAGWYRGDLHMHTAHSDGSCASQGNKQRVPCPLFLTVAMAARRGLDFIAISDHNTMSQLSEVRELQPYFDRLLLMPGRELTTFQGHANLWGVSEPVDFRVGSATVPTWDDLLKNVAKLHGVISINHPIRPSGEICMGCGWTPEQPVDMHLVQAIEAVNGRDAMRPDSGIPFWQSQLDKGLRPTAVGGSDNHDAELPFVTLGGGIVGTPTTVVHASELLMAAILDGIRAGHVFVDTEGSHDRMLDLTGSVDGRTAGMGDALAAPAGSMVRFHATATAPAGSRIEVIVDGKVAHPEGDFALRATSRSVSFDWPADGRRHWIRLNVRDANGQLLLLGNPVYVNY
jgi:hypothetical protein